MTSDPRPKRFPPPVFPPRRSALFARTPPAIFPVLLGLLGLAIALRAGLGFLNLPRALAELAAGVALALWVFGGLAYLMKLHRRPAVIFDDLMVMPSRAGLAAGSMGGMAASLLITPYAERLAMALLLASLMAHGVLALLTLRVLRHLPPEARDVNPGWHLSFVGFIVGAPAALALGQAELARVILWLALPVALVIWGISLVQLVRRVPPAPLRPMLAIHLGPAALLSLAATGTGQNLLATALMLVLIVILVALGAGAKWITETGFSALWGAFTFPLSAASLALLSQGGELAWAGLVVLAGATVAVPLIAWKVLKLWPGGQLAEKTNTAEA